MATAIELFDHKIASTCKLLGATYLRAAISYEFDDIEIQNDVDARINIYIAESGPEWQDSTDGHLPKMLKMSVTDIYEDRGYKVSVHVHAIPPRAGDLVCPYGVRYERPFWEQNR